MSEVETIKGTLREVYNEEKLPVIELMKMVLNENNIEYDENDEFDIQDSFFDRFYDDFVVVGDKMFRVENRKDLCSESIFEAVHKEDGTCDFLVQYYNGGCSFGEAIEEALKKSIVK